MNPHEYTALHILHVSAILILFGFTFYAFAAPATERKKVMIWTGIANLLIVLTGVRMWQALYGFQPLGWVIVKLVGWLAMAAFAGMAFRKREKAGLFISLSVVIGVVAAIMVYAQPF